MKTMLDGPVKINIVFYYHSWWRSDGNKIECFTCQCVTSLLNNNYYYSMSAHWI